MATFEIPWKTHLRPNYSVLKPKSSTSKPSFYLLEMCNNEPNFIVFNRRVHVMRLQTRFFNFPSLLKKIKFLIFFRYFQFRGDLICLIIGSINCAGVLHSVPFVLGLGPIFCRGRWRIGWFCSLEEIKFPLLSFQFEKHVIGVTNF